MDKNKFGIFKKEFDYIGSKIFSISSEDEFEELACRIFRLQYKTIEVYRNYVDLLKIDHLVPKKIVDIPFLPISFFKDNQVITKGQHPKITFYSSGTTGMIPGKHYVADIELYKKSFTQAFELFYGNPSDYCILALLPGYLERKGSSLIYMVNELMKLSNHHANGFFLNEFDQLQKAITIVKKNGQKFILIGVTYALLDFANEYQIDLSGGIVMETGGMKGTRKEMIKAEVHDILKARFNLDTVHSEYGMTELLSQAYSRGDGLYNCPPWMKLVIRDVYDPFNYLPNGFSGGINIIDLANIHSCSFIETKDLGRKNENGQFEILGRFDDSDIRGCNLLVS
jgi:phenylacetate-coenzyme A ligase PaaK-like adenylate-forming protein